MISGHVHGQGQGQVTGMTSQRPNQPLIHCSNCNKLGHYFRECKEPITSYGIIAYRLINSEYQFLMIRRKNSFGYIDYIRGKYSPYNIYQVQNIVDEMSLFEKTQLLNNSFETLWKNMWGDVSNFQYKNEEHASLKKFELMKEGVNINNEIFTIQNIIQNSKTIWNETEWEFPKGRRNYKEKDLDCALREFEEETGISKNKINIIENVLPFEEIFIGTNHKSYKHKYFLANMNNNEEILDNFQLTEVSKLEWKSLENCLETIRPYNLEKKNLIININKVLQEYKII
jgi:8-oxo-dGTP pyrophosphatase MutT (NUDIX family)